MKAALACGLCSLYCGGVHTPAAVSPQETCNREMKVVYVEQLTPRSDLLVLKSSEHKGRVRACVSAQSQFNQKAEEPGDARTLKIRGSLYSPEPEPNLQGLLRKNKLTQSRLHDSTPFYLGLAVLLSSPCAATTAVLLTQTGTSCRNRPNKGKLCSTANRCCAYIENPRHVTQVAASSTSFSSCCCPSEGRELYASSGIRH